MSHPLSERSWPAPPDTLITDGLTNRQSGAEMYLAEKTVNYYLSSMQQKLGFSRRTEAAVFAAELRRGGPAGGWARDSAERDPPHQPGAAA